MRFAAACIALVIASTTTGRARADDEVTLRLGTQAIDGSRYMADILALSAELEKRTRGTVKLAWTSDGRLGSERAMVDLLQRGTLDGGGFSETGLVAIAPEMAAWRAPGLFRSYDQVDRATAALDATTREMFDAHDAVFVMWADLGFAHVFAREPSRTVDEAIAAGLRWLAMPLDEPLFAAVANGTARAWVLPPLYTLAIQPQLVARVMWRLRYRYVVGGLVVSRAAWSRLSEHQRAMFLDVARAWQPRLRKSWRRESERGIAALARAGVAILPSTDAEQAAFDETAARRASKDPKLAELTAKIAAAAR